MGPTPADLKAWLADHGGRGSVRRYHGLDYARLADDWERLPRGSVCFPSGRVVPGYPRIGRMLALRAGLAAHFDAPVWVEEKLDGYNVRILREQGRTLALTRGGFVCPFTTHRLADLMPAAVFDDHPELVLCAEVAGPESPYQIGPVPGVAQDVALFVFDVMGANGAYWDAPDKNALCQAYALPRAPCFGRFRLDQLAELEAVIRRLDAEGREGVVCKQDGAPERRAKYATAAASLQHIRTSAAQLLELPAQFFVERILRLVLFEEERGRALAGRSGALGHALLDGLAEAVAQFRREGRVALRYRCRVNDPSVADELLAHLEKTSGHEVRIRHHALERVGDQWRLTFDRIPAHINGLLRQLLGPQLVYD